MTTPRRDVRQPGRALVNPQPPGNPTQDDAPQDDVLPAPVPSSLDQVVGGGSNAGKAIEAILGPRFSMSGDPETDCLAAMAAIDEWLRELPLRRALILHALHAQYYPANHDVWLRVALALGRSKSTVHNWAHVPELLTEM